MKGYLDSLYLLNDQLSNLLVDDKIIVFKI